MKIASIALRCVAALVGAFVLTACGTSTSESTNGQLAVVATTSHLGDFARAVGGDRASVTQLLQPNTDPHEYEPTPSAVNAVRDADVIIENGLGLDEWLGGVIRNAGSTATRVVTTAEVATRPGSGGEPDPHVWLDPRNCVLMVHSIEAAFVAADPANAAAFHANAERYVQQIQAMDADLLAQIDAIPAARRTIVTDHDAFGYFAARYGIRIVGTVIPSLTTQAEPSAKAVTELTATVRREGVRAIFSEASIDPKLEKALADETGIRLGDPLYGDALGAPDTPGATYVGMMRSNMDAIIAGISQE
jgi:ABC-type Zn uptake system ZnuABC Zn-binding protein ZnuA